MSEQEREFLEKFIDCAIRNGLTFSTVVNAILLDCHRGDAVNETLDPGGHWLRTARRSCCRSSA